MHGRVLSSRIFGGRAALHGERRQQEESKVVWRKAFGYSIYKYNSNGTQLEVHVKANCWNCRGFVDIVCKVKVRVWYIVGMSFCSSAVFIAMPYARITQHDKGTALKHPNVYQTLHVSNLFFSDSVNILYLLHSIISGLTNWYFWRSDHPMLCSELKILYT